MKLIDQGFLKFDSFLPVYNWYYPLSHPPVDTMELASPHNVFERLDKSLVESRGFYFHFPFCKTICTFCPFVRSVLPSEEALELYVSALIREVHLKARYDPVSQVPVGAIFFGGGTPSLLTPPQIRSLGNAIRDHYDLSGLTEFSVEMTIATITPEKLEAFRDIGVTHARFGIQTFVTRYREMFNLFSKIEDIYKAVKILTRYFNHISFDMLYGMNGQTDEEFVSDIQNAIALDLPNIDFYPINNTVTQTSLHRAFKDAGLPPTSGLRKFLMNILLRKFMSSGGYLPHNGHGYVKVSAEEINRNPVVTRQYTFKYHKYVYGYQDAEVLGFGTNAISTFNRYTMHNVGSWERYINDLLHHDTWQFSLGEHDPYLDMIKGIVLHLPYHGYVDKNKINLTTLHYETSEALKRTIDAGMVSDYSDRFELTSAGWNWYVNLLYYLSPGMEQHMLERFISERRCDADRQIEETAIPILRELL
jgi:anaerobilin synthase